MSVGNIIWGFIPHHLMRKGNLEGNANVIKFFFYLSPVYGDLQLGSSSGSRVMGMQSFPQRQKNQLNISGQVFLFDIFGASSPFVSFHLL